MDETAHRVEESAAAYVLDVPMGGAELGKKQPRKPPTAFKPGERPVGRAKGTPNVVTKTLREAVERAARDCHPQGLAGWLVERAQGGIGDRQIFAAVVQKVIPMQVNTSVQGGISINLGWLAQRGIGTNAAQARMIDAQVIDSIEHSKPSHLTTDALTDEGQGEGQG